MRLPLLRRSAANDLAFGMTVVPGRGVVYLALTDERIKELGILLIPPANSTFAGLLFGAAFSIRRRGSYSAGFSRDFR